MPDQLARIYLSGDRSRLLDEWNAVHPENPIVAGAITMAAASPDYDELRSHYNRLSAGHRMTWDEKLDIVYTPDELAAYEILTMWITGQAGPGDNAYYLVYSEARRCPECGSESFREQRAPLHLDPKRVDEMDLAQSDHGEVVCSERFRDVLDEHRIDGVSYRPVVWAIPAPGERRMHQLVVHPRLGPLAESFPLVKEHHCPVCGEYRNVGIDAPTFGPARQLRFPRSSYHGEAIALTREHLGGARKQHLIVISGTLYRVFRDRQVSGFWAEPARLEDHDSSAFQGQTTKPSQPVSV